MDVFIVSIFDDWDRSCLLAACVSEDRAVEFCEEYIKGKKDEKFKKENYGDYLHVWDANNGDYLIVEKYEVIK